MLSSSSVSWSESSHISKVFVCAFSFLIEKFTNPVESQRASSKLVQFPVFDGSMLFLMIIQCIEYLNSMTLGLLFQPHLWRILLNNSSM